MSRYSSQRRMVNKDFTISLRVLPVATLLLKTVFEDFFNPENGPSKLSPLLNQSPTDHC